MLAVALLLCASAAGPPPGAACGEPPAPPPSPQDKPLPIRFSMQHDTGAKDGRGARKLESAEEQALLKEFRALPGVKDASAKEGAFSLILAEGATLKLSELRAATKRVPVAEGFNQILLNTLRLEGKTALWLEPGRGRERLKDALKAARAAEASEEPDGSWACRFPASGPDLVALVKTVCARCGADYRLFEVLRDAAWIR